MLNICFIICVLRSFAFDTVNRRMPVILTRVIDDTSKLASKLTHENDHVSRSKSTVMKLNNKRNSRFSSVTRITYIMGVGWGNWNFSNGQIIPLYTL